MYCTEINRDNEVIVCPSLEPSLTPGAPGVILIEWLLQFVLEMHGVVLKSVFWLHVLNNNENAINAFERDFLKIARKTTLSKSQKLVSVKHKKVVYP